MTQISDVVKSALILAVALMFAALLNGGIYQIVIAGAGSGGSNDVTGDADFQAYRLNRITGEMKFLHGYRFIDAVPVPQPSTAASKSN